MKLEYNLGRYSLKVLNKSRSIDVLDFYYRNRRDFDKYESDKPASFYTENFISRMLDLLIDSDIILLPSSSL